MCTCVCPSERRAEWTGTLYGFLATALGQPQPVRSNGLTQDRFLYVLPGKDPVILYTQEAGGAVYTETTLNTGFIHRLPMPLMFSASSTNLFTMYSDNV